MPAHKNQPTVQGTAHPYARISDPTQRKGGGLERQTQADTEEFCRRFGFALAKRIRVDDGVSAFKGLNATPDHELGRFLSEAKRKVIRPGDCLLLENYDRLSRQDPWAAIGLVNDLRQLGIHVGRLDRMKLLRCDSTDYGDFFEAAVEFMRGNSESAAKSMRNSAAWTRKRQAARESGKVITRRLPAWVEERAGKLVLIPERAAVVRHIFQLAAQGYGHLAILKRLTAEGVPSFTAGPWKRSYVGTILADSRAIGQLQPCRADGTPDGPALEGYYPACVSESEYLAARAGAAQRRCKPGRIGTNVNVFSGLLRDAMGGNYQLIRRPTGPGRMTRPDSRVLINADSYEGKRRAVSFPFPPFESAVLSYLREIDPREVLGQETGPDDATVIEGQLDVVESELKAASAFMDSHGFSETIGKRVAALEDRKNELAALLADAKHRAEHPVSEAWGELQTLAKAIETVPDPEDARMRLRSALRRVVDGIWLLVVPRGLDRLCAVQVWFHGGERHRDYLILFRPLHCNGKATRPGGWGACSLVSADTSERDLRKHDDAKRLAAVLERTDVEAIRQKMEEQTKKQKQKHWIWEA